MSLYYLYKIGQNVAFLSIFWHIFGTNRLLALNTFYPIMQKKILGVFMYKIFFWIMSIFIIFVDVYIYKKLNYREQEDSYSLKEIHKYLCNNENHKENPPIVDEGKKIKHNIFVILNYYEYLAVGIKNQVFDEQTIKELIRGGVIKANKLFGDYITHLREKHTKNKNQFIEMQKLAEKWDKKAWYNFDFKRGTSD